jgi:hypothetical protein
MLPSGLIFRVSAIDLPSLLHFQSSAVPMAGIFEVKRKLAVKEADGAKTSAEKRRGEMSRKGKENAGRADVAPV